MIRNVSFALFAAVLCIAAGQSLAGEAGRPTLFDRYLHRIADKPKVEPHTYSQIPAGRKAEEFYSCGSDYCGDTDVCCTNQSDWSSYCCPGSYRCDGQGGCW